ncbi:hypothetical protein CR152_25375 [Massilia violaceinigra]|uniref:DUF72 domain-containing protein n=1 Tax=Massilia violaceinigra TaxID=2045208 RepID=A0A2D2DR59_9BURK|nr:DUF72 domain-containing protein [Massilia violaceinigra]ATQ77462.1 hypothetical protein CR152_25375 [Massilia violaceinigra]
MTNRTHQDAGTLRIGCAGWTISREAAGAFETAGSHLERYARVLGTVEINSSFYRPHQAKTYARWADSVPPDFRFAVKLPRTITHDARLVGIDAPLSQFAAEAGALGDKLGCLLVQLPPKLAFDAAVASDFFARLKDTFGCMIACEARHPTWFGEDASALLRRESITRVIADPAKGQEGAHVPTTESIYVRLHGSPRIYYSPYSADYLAQLARDMATHAAHGRDVWCIFDNTASGAALPNALDLRAALGLARPGQVPPRTAPDPGRPA